ncbi:hypothetical protein D3C86_1155710 [compost metagenome]
MRPLKSSSSRKRPVIAARLRVEGASIPSSGRARCADMTEATSAAIAARKGGHSIASSRAREATTAGRRVCESVAVSPCPGKCLAQARAPWA